ncbi:DUF3632 domain-containing protein [Aspergillus alliaceus]|uniref:DUF3632 domain-containing protein n=1 Tax=Petromyces alliaceus TaxID=209559 RepID=UPI0012A61FD5|nr:uncharacterized protein BDW43DRAFT_15366 [Aspergillus alliaceus]KAB8235887.1 hypothetical protein BDW43DRAFT_15366 [Aspergillus alliaceus]
MSINLSLRALIHKETGVVELKVMHTLEGLLHSFDADSIRVATEEIDKLNPVRHSKKAHEEVQEDELEEFLWQVWDAFIRLARQVPHAHPFQDRIVDLVEALTRLPPLSIEVWQSTIRLWADLPLLGPSMREAWVAPQSTEGPIASQEAEEWINLNAFAARLLKLDAISWTVFGIWELREALEEPPEIPGSGFHVRAAAEWIKHSGVFLYGAAIHGTEGHEERLSAATGSLYPGTNVMCLERWGFWKCRFGYIGEKGDDYTKNVALRARREMELIEQEYTT